MTRAGTVTAAFLAMLLGAGVWLPGCASIDLEDPDPLGLFPAQERFTTGEAQEYRSQFQIEQDPKAMTALLAHLVENGMTVAAVNDALGESGERYHDDQELKKNAGQYQQTDIAFKWGPDSNGRSVILFFRDGKLINFDPADFRQ